MKLLPASFTILTGWQKNFGDHRTYIGCRFFPRLSCLSRCCWMISRAICAQQRQFRSWSPDYKFFSELPLGILPRCLTQSWDEAHPLMSQDQPLVVALDDTPCRKTGKRIPWAKWLRDPLSPPFNTNLVWLFASCTPRCCSGRRRTRCGSRNSHSFQLAPAVKKPKAPKKPKKSAKSDSAEAQYKKALKEYKQALKEYRQKQRKEGLSAQGVRAAQGFALSVR